MFELEAFDGVRKIAWSALRPGMVLLSEIRINDAVPFELRGFPVITRELYAEVTSRYRLLPSREVLVALPRRYDDAGRMVLSLREAAAQADAVNRLRGGFFAARDGLVTELCLPAGAETPIIGTSAVDAPRLVMDQWNSLGAAFTLPEDEREIPSFFRRRGLEVTLADILAGKVDTMFRFPRDETVMVHLVVDFSLSMHNRGRIALVVDALGFFLGSLAGLLKNSRFLFYLFSDECKPVRFPFPMDAIPARETNYASFAKKVLHQRDKTVRNKVLLFTDGRPGDESAARELLGLFRKNQIDYTQIVFNLSEEFDELVDDDQGRIEVVDNIAVNGQELKTRRTTPEEREKLWTETMDCFTALARAAGGNQIVMNIDRALRFVAVEVYDRYLGLLSLASPADLGRMEAQGLRPDDAGPEAAQLPPGTRRWSPPRASGPGRA
jgi:hypothetical protein